MQDSSLTIDVAFCIDNGYASQLAVTLRSIMDCLSPSVPLRAHIVGSLSPATVDRFMQMKDMRLDMLFYPDVPDFSHLHISPAFQSRLSMATYYRLALPALLPELPRVLYLDADIIAIGDIAPLWLTHLQGYSTGVIDDYFLTELQRWLHLKLSVPRYFNAGVMLMDLSQWRSKNLAAQVAREITEHTDWEYNDQDGLNVVLDGQSLYVDTKWNVTTTRLQASAVKDPVLIHFTGQEKPWHYSCVHPYRDAYLSYLQKTPWRGELLKHFLDHEDQRLLAELSHKLPDGGKMAIYGCGARGRRLALYLRDQRPECDLRFMVDRSAADPFEGVRVYRQLPAEAIDALLIASIPYREEILAGLPCDLIAQGKVI